MDFNVVPVLKHFVDVTKLHPVLVNFTAALIPVSIASDFLAGRLKNESLRGTAWWTLVYAVVITPLTGVTGWLFWQPDDTGIAGMTIHKWLGTTLVVLVAGLFLWRREFHRRGQPVSPAYLVFGLALIGALIVQGHLGGAQVFGGG